jgi:hypothetical protein
MLQNISNFGRGPSSIIKEIPLEKKVLLDTQNLLKVKNKVNTKLDWRNFFNIGPKDINDKDKKLFEDTYARTIDLINNENLLVVEKKLAAVGDRMKSNRNDQLDVKNYLMANRNVNDSNTRRTINENLENFHNYSQGYGIANMKVNIYTKFENDLKQIAEKSGNINEWYDKRNTQTQIMSVPERIDKYKSFYDDLIKKNEIYFKEQFKNIKDNFNMFYSIRYTPQTIDGTVVLGNTQLFRGYATSMENLNTDIEIITQKKIKTFLIENSFK